MQIDIFTLFSESFDWFLSQRHVRNAADLGHEFTPLDLRAATPLRAGQVDDAPYGGGAGMLIRVDVVAAALERRYEIDSLEVKNTRAVIALSAGGRQFDDTTASRLAGADRITLLCGRYEGFDERVHEHLATESFSVGPYVLSGGELAAMVICDAVIRKLPGALGEAESAVEESFSPALAGAPEYPHYTRPGDWRGFGVPEVLLSGDHARIRAWRQEQSRARLHQSARGVGGRG